ncbi:BON domain-containing protein [Bryobacter aggregatus]|uniref:BON domain-containing protein n=1 Tax=Bryobacter aggregatus TaxID=360054 RepID=UPI0009B5C363|nr:BON domain-containing protein [Bryobacter aggregatus]
MFFVLRLLLACCLAYSADSDAVISSRLRAKLTRSKLKSDGLRFQVKQGVVEWEGNVKIAQHKGAATRMAKSSGATRVINRIQVSAKTATEKPREVVVQVPKR